MIMLGFALAFLGFILLSLSMTRHHRQLWPQVMLSKARTIGFRVGGYGSLAASLYCCMQSEGAAVGSVLWFGLLTAAALMQSMLLTYRPHWIVAVGTTALATSVITAFL